MPNLVSIVKNHKITGTLCIQGSWLSITWSPPSPIRFKVVHVPLFCFTPSPLKLIKWMYIHVWFMIWRLACYWSAGHEYETQWGFNRIFLNMYFHLPYYLMIFPKFPKNRNFHPSFNCASLLIKMDIKTFCYFFLKYIKRDNKSI